MVHLYRERRPKPQEGSYHNWPQPVRQQKGGKVVFEESKQVAFGGLGTLSIVSTSDTAQDVQTVFLRVQR